MPHSQYPGHIRSSGIIPELMTCGKIKKGCPAFPCFSAPYPTAGKLYQFGQIYRIFAAAFLYRSTAWVVKTSEVTDGRHLPVCIFTNNQPVTILFCLVPVQILSAVPLCPHKTGFFIYDRPVIIGCKTVILSDNLRIIFGLDKIELSQQGRMCPGNLLPVGFFFHINAYQSQNISDFQSRRINMF